MLRWDNISFFVSFLICKHPKNREDGSNFDDILTETVVTKRFIIRKICALSSSKNFTKTLSNCAQLSKKNRFRFRVRFSFLFCFCFGYVFVLKSVSSFRSLRGDQNFGQKFGHHTAMQISARILATTRRPKFRSVGYRTLRLSSGTVMRGSGAANPRKLSWRRRGQQRPTSFLWGRISSRSFWEGLRAVAKFF